MKDVSNFGVDDESEVLLRLETKGLNVEAVVEKNALLRPTRRLVIQRNTGIMVGKKLIIYLLDDKTAGVF